MGKDKTPPKFEENQAGATAKYLSIPPRKARLVLDAVRGKYVADALAILKFVPNFAAEAITDVIRSAVANAENSRPHDQSTGRPLDPLIAENLKLVRAYVDEGPRLKRVQPRAQGRAYRIIKRTCHITVVVEEVAPKPRPNRTQRAARRAAAAGRQATVTTPAAPKPSAPAPADASHAPQAEATTPAMESTAPAVEETDTRDEIGAPITTNADVAAEVQANAAAPDSGTAAEPTTDEAAADEQPKAE